MSCYAASKHIADETVARVQPKEKPKSTKPINKYGEMETSVSLDKYNGKLMNSIWGLYNRYWGSAVNKFNKPNFILETRLIISKSRTLKACLIKDKRMRLRSSNHSLFSLRFPNSKESYQLRPKLKLTRPNLPWIILNHSSTFQFFKFLFLYALNK